MNLRSKGSLWINTDKHGPKYPRLKTDIACDILVVGGGIVGALVAYYLSKKGRDVVVIDKGMIGCGSTAASTALLMYQLDISLSDLSRHIGRKKALQIYRISHGSVVDIKKLICSLHLQYAYKSKKVLQFASVPTDVAPLYKEYRAFKKAGFKVDFLDAKKLKEKFGISKSAALIIHESAEIDPYLLTQALIRSARKNGAQIFIKTELVDRGKNGDKKIFLTENANIITARTAIFSTGYESQNYLQKKIVDLKSSYVITSQPIPSLRDHWLNEYLIWETAKPYLYIRTTPDNRIIVGGADKDFADGKKRDRLIGRQSRILRKKILKLLPSFPFTISYAWAGTFGATKDGVGYIGSPKGFKDDYFALGFGGNGITFGLIAAQMLVKTLTGKPPKAQKLFSFER